MRWLMIVLLVSVVALLVVSGGVAQHIWREHRRKPAPAKQEDGNIETEEAP